MVHPHQLLSLSECSYSFAHDQHCLWSERCHMCPVKERLQVRVDINSKNHWDCHCMTKRRIYNGNSHWAFNQAPNRLTAWSTQWLTDLTIDHMTAIDWRIDCLTDLTTNSPLFFLGTLKWAKHAIARENWLPRGDETHGGNTSHLLSGVNFCAYSRISLALISLIK